MFADGIGVHQVAARWNTHRAIRIHGIGVAHHLGTFLLLAAASCASQVHVDTRDDVYIDCFQLIDKRREFGIAS